MVKAFVDELFIEATKEECCIEDCLEVVKIYTKCGEYECAIERTKDILRSLKKLEELQRKNSMRKKVIELKDHGVNAGVVKRSV